MASKTEIANIALQKLGSSQITDIDAGASKGAVEMAARFDSSAKSVLRLHNWNFATKRATLAALTTTPEYEFSREFQLPSDLLRIISIENDPDYQVEGLKILSSANAPLKIKYISIVTDYNQWDSLAIEALASELAYTVAERMTESNTKKEAARVDRDAAIAIARAADGTENPPDELEESTWIMARGGFNQRYVP